MNKLSIATVMVLGLWLLTGCGSEEVQQEKIVRPVKSLIIGGISDQSGKGFPGVTKESQETEMSFRVGGPIIKFNVVEGARIEKGDLIAEIDPRDYKVTVESTKARYNQAKSESDRYYRLWKKGSVAENDYELKLAAFHEAEAAWVDAKNALRDTKLNAPYTGFFGPKLAELGDKVRARQAITSIVDLSVVEVTTTIPEQLAIQFRNFDSYEVRLEAYPDVVFNANLKELEKKPTPEGFPLHLFLEHVNEKNDTSQIKVGAGMSCRANITLGSSLGASRIIIPLSSVFEGDIENSTMVWVINTTDNTVKSQSVVVGDLVGHDGIEITEGLSNGNQIVTAGVHRLIEGDIINDIDILN